MATTTVREVTTATFDRQVAAGTGAILVEFTADWCPPCRVLAPILDEIAREQAGKLTILALNVDHDPAIANRFGVMSFPTLILFRDGQPLKQLVGARPKHSLLRELAAYLS